MHFGFWRWGTRKEGNREKVALSSPSLFHCLGTRELWEAAEGEQEVYLMPVIKPPAAGPVSHGSSQPSWSHHLRELHLRAEGRRLARREVELCMKGMQTGKPSITVFGPPILVVLHSSVQPGQDRMTHLRVAGTSLLSWWRNQAHFKPLCSCPQLLSSSQPSSWLMPISLLHSVE